MDAERIVVWPCGCRGFMVEYREHGCRKHGYWSPPPGTIYDDRAFDAHVVRLRALHALDQAIGPELIRPDVVTAVRFALASLPEQSRMLRVRGARRVINPQVIDSDPVSVSAWR